ncbi:terminase gpA endonuclease subunit [uncultured Methylobacterium sp.]|uniref:terminase gpA endonuclease subunit n=1 Tax=uncultured Methylobacterium sp. TaxID=157278 RepID=UPI00342E4101
MRRGRWIATAPRPGAYPSYHFDALSSPFVPWDKIAERAVVAGDDPNKVKAFYNLTLGRPYELRGDAPDHERLMARRESDLKRGRVPARGLLLTAAADVQMRGIWLEILAHAPNRETWVVEALYLDGDTADPRGDVFEKLRREALDREFPDAFGRKRRIDALAIDSGYRSHVVYAFVRENQRLHPDTGREMILATKGADGWGRPAIGQPTLVDIDLDGRKIKQGGKVWLVGTWSIKGAFYADVRKDGVAAGRSVDPDGYCHFATWLDEVYFRQITSEYITDDRKRGRISKVWKLRVSEKDNHYLDCRVYNLALAEYLGASTMAPDEWAALARARGLPDELSTPDLFTPARRQSVSDGSSGSPPPAAPPPPVAPAPSEAPSGWFDRPTDFWF